MNRYLFCSFVVIHEQLQFPRVWVWVRVGYPQLTIYLRQLKYSGFQPTIYPTTDFLKHLILSYSFEIKQINERTNIYLKFYFKIMFLSHNNVVFIIKSKSKILINSLKSAYNLASISYIFIDTLL
jgi:hypothetical protein